MILSDAQCVRTALQFAARVDALSNTFANLETDLLRFAVQVVGAVAVKMTAFDEVVRVAAVSRWANAGSVLTNRSGTTFHVAAFVYALASHAAVIEGTRNGVAAGAGRRIGAGAHLDLLTTDERVAEEAFFAAAVVATDGVDANCIVSTSISVALINIWNN